MGLKVFRGVEVSKVYDHWGKEFRIGCTHIGERSFFFFFSTYKIQIHPTYKSFPQEKMSLGSEIYCQEQFCLKDKKDKLNYKWMKCSLIPI